MKVCKVFPLTSAGSQTSPSPISHSDQNKHRLLISSEAVAQRCSVKKVFLEISQNSQENTCARASFFNKVAGSASGGLLLIVVDGCSDY